MTSSDILILLKCFDFLMASTSRASPDDDGYKRFTEDIHNVSYGSNCSSKNIVYIVRIITVILSP